MELIKKYFPSLSNKQLYQFYSLKRLYINFNKIVNIISRKTDYNLFYLHHVLYCLGIAKVYSFHKGSKVIDYGTGGGFPGIPLSIMFPKVQFYLIDSTRKKIKVLEKIISIIKLKNAIPIWNRVEKIKTKFDFITIRGISINNLKKIKKIKENFIKKCNSNLKNRGIFYLKGGNIIQEKRKYPNAKIFLLKDYFQELFFLTKKIIWISNKEI